ncbi:hypothetical protein [Pseudomonas bharatica]|uniref:hypothetical protein n=1 Tax=Pseudomonas bharatica TaxID=2692112 RepID=UPI003B283A82
MNRTMSRPTEQIDPRDLFITSNPSGDAAVFLEKDRSGFVDPRTHSDYLIFLAGYEAAAEINQTNENPGHRDQVNTEGCKPEISLRPDSSTAAGSVAHGLDKAEGEQPDLNSLRLQVAERGSLLEHWLQLANVCDDNLADLMKETRALLDQQRPTWERAAKDILAERRRQLWKGYSAAHDDLYSPGELSSYAAAFALIAGGAAPGWVYQAGISSWQVKTSDPRTMLVTSGALILAELERIDREAEKAATEAELLRLRQMTLDVTND